MNEMQPIELTLSTQTLYSSSRRNIMPAIVQPDIRPGVPTRGEVRAAPVPQRSEGYQDRPATADELIEHLAGGKLQPPTQEFAEKANKAEVTRRFRERFHPEYDQTGNASLEDSRRAEEAGKLLGIGELSRTQREALLKAHYAEDAFGKVKALREGGFDRKQTRALIESHLAGMMPPTGPDVSPVYDDQIQAVMDVLDPASFNDAELSNFAKRIKDLYGGDFLDRGMLEKFAVDIKKHAEEVPTADIAKSKELYDAIAQIISKDDERTGRVDPRQRRGTYDDELKEYRDLTERVNAGDEAAKELRRKHVRDIASSINLQVNGDYDGIFKMIIDEGSSLDYVVNRIVSAPLDSESGDWSLGFYGQINLDTITNILRTQKDNLVVPGDPVEQARLRAQRNVDYQSALEIEEAIRLAHEVNKSIINADLSTFGRIAGSLSDEKLSRLSKVKGAGVVGRLLEVEHGNLIAKDSWINGDNYAEMMGKSKNQDTGLLNPEQEYSALDNFRALVKRAHDVAADDDASPELKAELKELGELDDWQVELAFNVGKAMYNLSFRGGEWISQGKVPAGDLSYVSFPQETIARILNWPQWMLQRFTVAKSRGGVTFLENAIAVHQKFRAKDGYGEMGLSKIGGRKVENFEMPDMTGARGWWASWRGRQLMMETIPMELRLRNSLAGKSVEREGEQIGNGKVADMGLLLDTGGIKIGGKEFEKLNDVEKRDYIESIFLDKDGKVRADFNRGLGAALYYALKPSAHDVHKYPMYHKAKEGIRGKIWAKAAAENPLGVVPFLHGLEYEDGAKVSILDWKDKGNRVLNPEEWQKFSRKLFQLNEIKMQKIKNHDFALTDPELKEEKKAIREAAELRRDQALEALKGITLESVMRDVEADENRRSVSIESRSSLTDPEKAMLGHIKKEGEKASKHLANIRFSHIPFLNDLSLEKVNYGITGAEAYRRVLNDTSGFQAANDALIKLMNNPTKFKEPEEIFEAIMPFVDNVGGILATEEGQKKGYVWVEGVLDMFERGANTPTHEIGGIKLKTLATVERKIRQFPLVNELLQVIHKPNSKAQNTAGPDASVWDNQKLFKASEEGLHAGVMSEEEIKKFRKRFGAHWLIMLKMLFRAALGGAIVAATEVPVRAGKDLKM